MHGGRGEGGREDKRTEEEKGNRTHEKAARTSRSKARPREKDKHRTKWETMTNQNRMTEQHEERAEPGNNNKENYTQGLHNPRREGREEKEANNEENAEMEIEEEEKNERQDKSDTSYEAKSHNNN